MSGLKENRKRQIHRERESGHKTRECEMGGRRRNGDRSGRRGGRRGCTDSVMESSRRREVSVKWELLRAQSGARVILSRQSCIHFAGYLGTWQVELLGGQSFHYITFRSFCHV